MDLWHFPRPELAAHYLNIIETGITSYLAIIAPRRKGKTLFMLQDLATLARKKKYYPVYASLWQNINLPHEGLILALEEGIEALQQRSTLGQLLNAKIRKTAVSNELLGRVEIEFADNPAKPTAKELAYLDRLLTDLVANAGSKTVLLMIDEVQHLATAPAFEPLMYALRTSLDKRQGRIKAVFTGSSRHFMNQLFNESRSPFYHFVESVPFPDLDERFAAFLGARLADEYDVVVSPASLQRAFETLDRSPYWMMKVAAHILTHKAGVDAALKEVLQLMEAAEGYEITAQKMKAVDKMVFIALCEGGNPFAKAFMAQVEQVSGVKGSVPNIQRAIQRLAQANLISQSGRGLYHIEKPGLRSYLIANKTKAF